MPSHRRRARVSSRVSAYTQREVASASPIDLEVGAKTTPRACRTAQRAREKSARSGARASRAGAATRARGRTIPAARAAVARMHILRARKVCSPRTLPPPKMALHHETSHNVGRRSPTLGSLFVEEGVRRRGPPSKRGWSGVMPHCSVDARCVLLGRCSSFPVVFEECVARFIGCHY